MSNLSAKATIIESIEANIASLVGFETGPCSMDIIYAWPNGLGVCMIDNEPRVVGVQVATDFSGRNGKEFFNGKGEKAQRMYRGCAAKAARIEAEALLALVNES